MVLWLLLEQEDGESCRRWRQDLRLRSHGGHPAPLNRRSRRWRDLGRSTRPLTLLGLLEPQKLLLPRPTGVRRAALGIPIRDSQARPSSLWAGVGTRTDPVPGSLNSRPSGRIPTSWDPAAGPSVARTTAACRQPRQAAASGGLRWSLQAHGRPSSAGLKCTALEILEQVPGSPRPSRRRRRLDLAHSLARPAPNQGGQRA